MKNFYKRLAMVCTTIALFTFVAISQTTITAYEGNNDDDCEEFLVNNGTDPLGFMDAGSGDLELCTEHDGEPHIVGMIFRDVTIPVGATITNAYVQFECDEIQNYPTVNLTVLGAKLANVTAPFANTPGEISSKPKTTATVAWAPPMWDVLQERGPKQQTPNIKTIIQEIIGVSGWASGNNMLIMVTDPGLVKAIRTAEAYESGAALAPSLVVTFTATVGEDPIRAELPVLLYPNPSKGQLNIKNPSLGEFGYSIYTISGKLVSSRNSIDGSTTEVDMSGFAKGAYLVEIKAAGKTVKEKLILK